MFFFSGFFFSSVSSVKSSTLFLLSFHFCKAAHQASLQKSRKSKLSFLVSAFFHFRAVQINIRDFFLLSAHRRTRASTIKNHFNNSASPFSTYKQKTTIKKKKAKRFQKSNNQKTVRHFRQKENKRVY